MTAAGEKPYLKAKTRTHAFRRAVFRGLGVLVPPLLTILIFIWVGSTINQYVLKPVTAGACEALVWAISDISADLPLDSPTARTATFQGRAYYRLDDDKFVPLDVHDLVLKHLRDEPVPKTALAMYRRYVEMKYLQQYFVIPFFLALFMLVLYLLGKFMAAGIGAFFWNVFERGIGRLPLVRTVYSGVKQVSDFMFNERELEFTRVVAVEYPRKGIWSLGFVTSESFADIRSAASEPVLAVFIPCSPLPLTGYTVSCLRSECIDVNMTFDQACQFTISCGVVVPPQQIPEPATTADGSTQHAGQHVSRQPEVGTGR